MTTWRNRIRLGKDQPLANYGERVPDEVVDGRGRTFGEIPFKQLKKPSWSKRNRN